MSSPQGVPDPQPVQQPVQQQGAYQAGSYPPAPPAAAPPTYGYPGAAPARTADAAIWALVCAIGSWLLCPVVLAVVALVLARNADDAIARSGGTLTGAGMATASRVVAWVHLAVVGLALLFGLAVLVGLAVGSH